MICVLFLSAVDFSPFLRTRLRRDVVFVLLAVVYYLVLVEAGCYRGQFTGLNAM